MGLEPHGFKYTYLWVQFVALVRVNWNPMVQCDDGFSCFEPSVPDIHGVTVLSIRFTLYYNITFLAVLFFINHGLF